VAGGWKILQNEELHNFCASPNVRVMKSRRVGHVACMGEMTTFWLETLKGRDYLEDLDVDRIIIFSSSASTVTGIWAGFNSWWVQRFSLHHIWGPLSLLSSGYW